MSANVNLSPVTWTLAVLIAWLMLGVGLDQSVHAQPRSEINYPSEAFKKLTSFEAHVLEKADRTFARAAQARDMQARNLFEQAGAEYESFIVEFPNSEAVPYALLRKARSLQLEGKRFESLREYKQVLDYFPNAVPFAAPAAYYIGEAQWQNGDEAAAVATWIKMAEDTEYRRHWIAAHGIHQLAEYLYQNERFDDAARHFMDVAINFRRSNDNVARSAISHATHHHIRISPNEKNLREFYRKVHGFDHNPQNLPSELDNDPTYWNHVRNLVNHNRNSSFNDTQREQMQNYYRYWYQQMRGRFQDDDNYQIALANMNLRATDNLEGWYAAMDRQFERGFTTGDFPRVIRWIGLYRGHQDKQLEYYRRINYSRMTAEQVLSLARTIYESVGDREMGSNALRHVKWADVLDRTKAEWAGYLHRVDPDTVPYICAQFEDQIYGKHELLRFHHRITRDLEKGAPLANDVSGDERFTNSALTMLAELYEHDRQWDQAIVTWRRVDNPPETSFRIAACHERAGRPQQAIAQLTEVENFFRDVRDIAPRAAFEIARVHQRRGDRDAQVAALRAVLTKYPQSSQSRNAHVELQRAGVTRITGGVDER